MKKSIALALAATCVASAAQAQSPSCYVGAKLGYTMANTETSLDLGPGLIAPGPVPGALVVDGFGGEGVSGGIGGGCDVRMQQFVFGVFGDYDWHGVEFSASSGIPGFTGDLITLDIESQWTLGGRAGVMASSTTLVYGLVGWTQVQTSDLESPLLNASFDVGELNGLVVGGGMETEVSPGLWLGAEYRYTKLDDEDISIIPNVASVNLDTGMHSAYVTLKYKIGVTETALK